MVGKTAQLRRITAAILEEDHILLVRETGESMRAFITRMDASGGLDELSDALDREYYGGGTGALSARRCRELRRYMRKAVQHG